MLIKGITLAILFFGTMVFYAFAGTSLINSHYREEFFKKRSYLIGFVSLLAVLWFLLSFIIMFKHLENEAEQPKFEQVSYPLYKKV